MVGIIRDGAQLREKFALVPSFSWNDSSSANALGGTLALCGPPIGTLSHYIDLSLHSEQ